MTYEEIAKSVASIIGPQSAVAQALAELHRRRNAGEDVDIMDWGNTWVVVPNNRGAHA